MSLAATYVDADTFTIEGNYTDEFIVNRKARCNCGVDGYKYVVVSSSSFSSPDTTVNLTADSDDLTANLTEVDWSVVKPGTEGNIALHAHQDEDNGGQLDHGLALTGLTDDDHTIYALLTGRAGGQTIYGGDAANDDITIEPTSHATKTAAHVLLAPSGGSVGVGTTPIMTFDVKAPSSGGIRVGDSTGAFYRAWLINLYDDAGELRLYTGSTVLTTVITSSGNSYIQGGNVGIGIAAPLAKLHIDQTSTTAAIPVLTLDQGDDDQDMIEFIGAIGTGNAIEGVGAKTLTTTHFIKITLPGSLTRYIPCGTIA